MVDLKQELTWICFDSHWASYSELFGYWAVNVVNKVLDD